MEKDCAIEKLNEEKEVLKDEFITLKRQIYKLLLATQDLIRMRYTIQAEKGNNVTVIQKNAEIRNNLQQLNFLFSKMKEIFKKNVKLKGKKYTEEQLDERFKVMEIIKQQISTTKELDENAITKSEDEVRTLTDFKSYVKQQGGMTPAREYRELSGEEQAALDRWKGRDEEQDIQIIEIGEGVDRLGAIAIEMGEKAERQAQLVKSINEQADKTSHELVAINTKINDIIKTQGGMNLCCKLVLTFTLIAMVGYIINLVQKLIMK